MRALLDHEQVPPGTPPVRPAAVHYVHTVLTNSTHLPNRSVRELLTLGKALDCIAEGSYGAAADILAQRMKAVEKAARDGRWEMAECLELIPASSVGLAERSEEFMAAKEVRLAVRAGLPVGGKSSEKGKGHGKDKGKGAGKNSKGPVAEAPPAQEGGESRRARKRNQ